MRPAARAARGPGAYRTLPRTAGRRTQLALFAAAPDRGPRFLRRPGLAGFRGRLVPPDRLGTQCRQRCRAPRRGLLPQRPEPQGQPAVPSAADEAGQLRRLSLRAQPCTSGRSPRSPVHRFPRPGPGRRHQQSFRPARGPPGHPARRPPGPRRDHAPAGHGRCGRTRHPGRRTAPVRGGTARGR